MASDRFQAGERFHSSLSYFGLSYFGCFRLIPGLVVCAGLVTAQLSPQVFAQTSQKTDAASSQKTGSPDAAAQTPAAQNTAARNTAPQSGPEMVTVVEGIAEFRFPNGLKVLLFPDASRPTVTVNLTVFVGSRHEGYGEAGMAHLLEHMVFKGTPTNADIPGSLKQRGATYNGTTWLDRTNYYETLPASDENLEFALKMEADRMINSFIKGEDLAKEMTVVRNEFESGENEPQQVLLQRMMNAAFEWHNYGKSTIGNRADIERVPVENLQRFYRKFYQPDNAMLIVAGKFDPRKALQLINETFGAIPRPERTLETTYTEEPAQDGERLVTVRRVGEIPLAGLVYHIPSGSHPDFAAIDILSTILTSQPSGRLYEALVKRRVAASVAGFTFALHDPGVILFAAEAAQGTDGQSLLQTLTEAVETTVEKPFTPEEVERARQELLRQRELRAANSASVAIDLSDWAAQGDWRLFFLFRDRVEKVTPEDVQRVAAQFLTQTNRTAGIFHPTEKPQRTSVPAPPDVAAMIGDYKGREEVSQGEEFDPSPTAIESRLVRNVLSSGIKVTMFPRKTRGSTVDLRLNFRYGNPDELKGRATAAEFLPEMLTKGTKNRTRQQISDELDNYRAQLSASGDAGILTIYVKTKRENLGAVLEIVEDILRNPLFPAEELEILREEQLAAAGQQLADPTAIASNQVQRKISRYEPDDPRYVATIEEELARIKAVSIQDVRAVYSDLVGAGTGELTIVGDFDPEQAQTITDRITSGWKSNVPFQRLARESLNNDKGEYLRIETPDKANACYMAGMTLAMRDDDADYPAMAIGNFILGGGGLSSRLANRVRQQEGLSYGIQSALQPSAVDKRTVFYIFAISNPENAAQVQTAIQEELTKLVENGITQQELDEAREGYLKEQQVRRTNDRSLATMLEAYAFIGRDLNFVASFEDKIRALTVEEVNAALKKNLKPERLFIVAAGDFAAKAPAP